MLKCEAGPIIKMNKKIIIAISFVVIVVILAWFILPSEKVSEEAVVETEVGDTLLIDFYGKVTDQNGNPVSGAGIKYSITETPFENGSFQEMQSDSAGLFTFKAILTGT